MTFGEKIGQSAANPVFLYSHCIYIYVKKSCNLQLNYGQFVLVLVLNTHNSQKHLFIRYIFTKFVLSYFFSNKTFFFNSALCMLFHILKKHINS